jgi:hypothetical protein
MTVSKCLDSNYASIIHYQALGVGAVRCVGRRFSLLCCYVVCWRPCVGGVVVAEFWWCCTLFLLVVGGGVLLCLVALRCCYVPLGRCYFGGAVVALHCLLCSWSCSLSEVSCLPCCCSASSWRFVGHPPPPSLVLLLVSVLVMLLCLQSVVVPSLQSAGVGAGWASGFAVSLLLRLISEGACLAVVFPSFKLLPCFFCIVGSTFALVCRSLLLCYWILVSFLVCSFVLPVWWDEEMVAVTVHRMECILAARSR